VALSDLIEILDWDSEFFGITIGRVASGAGDLSAAAAEADARECVCTYMLLPAGDAERLLAAQRVGFMVVDVRIELCAQRVSVTDPAHGCRLADRDLDAGWLASVASRRFINSRFSIDPKFGSDAAGRMYEAWIARGLAGGHRQVVVLDDQAGFVICGHDAPVSEGVIELIATSGTADRGSGSRLMSGAHELFLAQGLSSASVVTQAANVAALRLYEGSGYRVRRADVWLHRWHDV
jgi:dTDP-4-amino-4,6-dideoxy-D-galactose acyltransferase